MRFVMLTLCSIIIAALAGCGGLSKKTAKKAGGEPAQNVAADSSLQGKYTDQCTKSTVLGASEQLKISFNGNKYTQERLFFNDPKCNEEGGKIFYVGEFTVDPQVPNAITFNLEDAYVETTSEEMAKIFNGVNFCGYSSYESGKRLRVTGGTSKTLCPLHSVPATLHGTYAIEKDHLYFDSDAPTSMAKTKKERVTTIDRGHYFTRE